MIRVIVLLDKGGTNTDVHHLGSLTIANAGTGSESSRNYNISQHSSSKKGGPPPRVVRRTNVNRFPSKDKSVWKLVAAALNSLGHSDVQ